MANVSVAESIAESLSPHLGAHTADVVARHLCAKYEVSDDASAEELQKLQDFLRRGLVAYLGAEAAERVAAECLDRVRSGAASG
jgi:hypothetical protein